MLLYSFGAKVKFSDKWHLEDIFPKLAIQNANKEIIVIRYRDTYTIKIENEKFFYPIKNMVTLINYTNF